MEIAERIEDTPIRAPRGAFGRILTRQGTSDLPTAGSTFNIWGVIDDEYDLQDLRVSGVFVDVGAHIGVITMAVLLDNPEARAICIEPVPENAEMIRRNAQVNGLTERVSVLEVAIAPGEEAGITYDYEGDDYLRNHRYIGGISRTAPAGRTAVVPTISLASLVEMAGGEIEAMKLDCEGCEWDLLAEPGVERIRTIFGEWHGHPMGDRDGYMAIADLLSATHDVENREHLGGTGLFWAVRR